MRNKKKEGCGLREIRTVSAGGVLTVTDWEMAKHTKEKTDVRGEEGEVRKRKRL